MSTIADRMAGLAAGPKRKSIADTAAPEAAPEKPAASPGGPTELHDHGDGTFHSVIGGTKTEHPHIGHALVHIGAHHESEGKHMHIHQDGAGEHTSHQASESGGVEGPHNHENIEELKSALDQFFSEEENEPSEAAETKGGGSLFE